MYTFDNFQKNIFDVIKPLIEYDLSKNEIKFEINSDIFLKYHNKEDINFNSEIDREKVKSTFDFYNYILNKEICESFIKIFDFIKKEKPWMFSNSYLNRFFESFDNKNLSILFYTNLVVKTLSNPSYYRKSFYEEDSDELSTVDSWQNSTNVLENQFILIKNFIIYNDLSIDLEDKDNLCYSNLFKFMNVLIKEKLVKEKTITRISSGKKNIKTHKFWSIINEIDLSGMIIGTNFSSVPYNLVQKNNILYEKGCHFSKLITLCRKNWYSGEIFNLTDTKYIDKILKLKLYIDKESLISIKKKIEEEEELLNIDIKNKIKDLSISIKSIFNKKKINEIDKEEIKKNQKKINKLIDVERMNRMIESVKDDEVKYLPIFFDFRGRNYFDDYLSPTFSRLTRISFFYGYYEKSELENVDISLIKNFIKDDVEVMIKKTLIRYNLKEENYCINAVFWVLIGIGKHFIKKEKIKIPLEEFIKEGYKYLEKKDSIKINIKDFIEIEHYKNILENLKKGGRVKKQVILKDATASVLQNLIKILGPKDQDAINLANLGDTENWYDPYSHILKKFKESFEKKENMEYFTRSTIKKTIMTNPYSAGEKVCWNYFKKSVEKDFNMKENEANFLRKDFKNFYEFVTDFFEELNFFRNSSKKIIEYYIEMAKREKKIIMEIEDSKTNLIYFNHKTHYIDIRDECKKRFTKKIKKIDYSKINYKKIYTSIRANIAHWLDAIFLRKLVNRLKNPIFTIHDEFAIDVMNVNNLIIKANEIANENIRIDIPWDHSHDFKIFSIFILV